MRAADPAENISVTVLLRAPEGLAEQLLSGQYHPESQEGSSQNAAAVSQGMAEVRTFAQEHGLRVQSEDAASRRVVLSGTVQQMQQAFGVSIGEARDQSGQTFRSYSGDLQLPPELQGKVTAVLGLDQRPVARHAGQHQ